MTEIIIEDLDARIPGLTQPICDHMQEACVVCLESEGHNSGVKLKLSGIKRGDIDLKWSQILPAAASLAWQDEEVATEHGATCLAILLAIELTPYTVVERSFKGTGFDYWLGKDNQQSLPPFSKMARFEISGIRTGNQAAVRARINVKKKQTTPTDSSGLPAYISVVEFGTPHSQFIQK